MYRYLSSSKFISVYLFPCLSQCPGILLVNLRVYVRLLIGISLSLFVSQCVKQCPTILSLIVGVTVHLLIRIAHSLFFPSECFYPCSVIIVSDSMCIGTSLHPRLSLSLSLSLCLSQCQSILLVISMYVINRVQLNQRVISAIEKLFLIF